MVKVHCIEGIANHNVPESCAGTREGGGEALTGVRIGQLLSRENDFLSRTPTRALTWKATQTDASTQASVWTVWSETLACAHTLRKGNREILGLAGDSIAGPQREAPLLGSKPLDLTPQVAARANELYQARVHGESQQDQDWHEAEREIRKNQSGNVKVA
jgi:hypothetical protein